MSQRLSREAYRLWAQGQQRRYERIAGEPVGIPRQCAAHVRTKGRGWLALDHAVRRANLPCEVLGSGVTVEIGADTDYEPAVVVHCGPALPDDAFSAANPVIVVEVTSQSDSVVGPTDRMRDYFQVASVKHYLIVCAFRHEVIHHRCAGAKIVRTVFDAGSIVFDPPGITIDLAEIYPASP